MIGIIGAMPEEVQALKDLMIITEETKIHDIPFFIGTLENKDVILMQSGVGKVNAAYSTTLLLEHFQIDALINIGSAGGLNLDENVGDVVVGKYVKHHDLDVTAFGRKMGELEGLPKAFEADMHLLKATNKCLEELNIPYHVGLIVSGDQFIAREEQVSKIKLNFKDAMCAEMEAASIAHIAYLYHKPFIILRSLSDIFGKGGNNIQFDEYLKIASKNSAALCQKMMRHI